MTHALNAAIENAHSHRYLPTTDSYKVAHGVDPCASQDIHPRGRTVCRPIAHSCHVRNERTLKMVWRKTFEQTAGKVVRHIAMLSCEADLFPTHTPHLHLYDPIL